MHFGLCLFLLSCDHFNDHLIISCNHYFDSIIPVNILEIENMVEVAMAIVKNYAENIKKETLITRTIHIQTKFKPKPSQTFWHTKTLLLVLSYANSLSWKQYQGLCSPPSRLHFLYLRNGFTYIDRVRLKHDLLENIPSNNTFIFSPLLFTIITSTLTIIKIEQKSNIYIKICYIACMCWLTNQFTFYSFIV